MSDYEDQLRRVQRERETEQRIRAMDAPEIVEWLLDLEDVLVSVIRWRGLDGDGISDPVRDDCYAALWTNEAHRQIRIP